MVGMALLGLMAAAAGIALVEIVIRRSDVGAGLALGYVVLSESSVIDLTVLTSPVFVGVNDVLFLVFLTAAIARLLRVERLTNAQRLIVLFGALVAWSLASGIGPFGLPAATNEARKFLTFTATVLYFSTIEPRPALLQRIGRVWLVAAGALAALALIRWTANTAGISGGLFGTGTSLRVIPSDAALIIGQGALIGLPLLIERTRGWSRYVTPALLVVIVVLQHRTVWLVTAIGMGYLLLRGRALTPRTLAALGVGAAIFAALTFTVFDDQDLSSQLAESSQATGTFEWRVAGWGALIADSGPQTPAEVAVGLPFGGGWERSFDGLTVDVTPHNFYLETFLRVGLVGVVALVLLYVIALRGSPGRALPGRRRPPGTPTALSSELLRTVIAIQLLYFISYTPDIAQSMLLGLGCAVAANARRTEQPEPSLVGG